MTFDPGCSHCYIEYHPTTAWTRTGQRVTGRPYEIRRACENHGGQPHHGRPDLVRAFIRQLYDEAERRVRGRT